MEFGEDNMPCQHGQAKVCRHCENSSIEYTTRKMFCYNVSGLRMALFGPRQVAPTNTCCRFAMKKVAEKNQQTR